jgi:uncharacterized membrane protein
MVGLLSMIAPFIPEFAVVVGPTMSAIIFIIGMLLFVVVDKEQNASINKIEELEKELREAKDFAFHIQDQHEVMVTILENELKKLSN